MINKKLIGGSLVLLITFNIFNFLNFIFHFSMARLLSVAEFGILSALFTIIYILSGFSESIQIIFTKYATNENNKGKLKSMLNKALRKSSSVAVILFLVFLVLAVLIAYLTKIDYFLIALTGLMVFVAFLVPISRGVLQGKKRFRALGLNMVSESVIKLVFAVVLVFAGWKVYGAMIGTIIGSFAALGLSFISLKDITSSKEERTNVKDIYNYTAPSFVIVLTVLVFYSIDVFIARIFFPAEIAGAYAISSILAKTIFLGTQPVSRAMFPMSAEKTAERKSKANVFHNSLVILSGMIIVALVIFYFFPGLIIWIFSGRLIVESASILFFLAIAMSLISLTNLVLLYKLSLGKTRGYPYLVIFVLIEIGLLSYFSANLLQFSVAFILASAIFLWGATILLRD